jgi:GNAT superfamily N-acetyltransferase
MHAFQATIRRGELLRVRPVQPGDEAAVAVLLGPRPRTSRPGANALPARAPRPTPIEARQVAWVAVAINHGGQPIVGAARYLRLPGGHGTGEVAVAVHSGFRGQGLGRLLLETLMLVALESGVAKLLARVEPENAAAGRLLRSLGAVVKRAGDESVEYELPVGWGDRTLASSSGFRAPRPEQLRAASGEH